MKLYVKGTLETHSHVDIMCFSLKSNKRVCGSNARISFPPNYKKLEKTVGIPCDELKMQFLTSFVKIARDSKVIVMRIRM